jgi:hypothetical protein
MHINRARPHPPAEFFAFRLMFVYAAPGAVDGSTDAHIDR